MEPESEEEVEQELGDTRSVKSLNDSVKLSDSGWGELSHSFSMENEGPTSQFCCGEKW